MAVWSFPATVAKADRDRLVLCSNQDNASPGVANQKKGGHTRSMKSGNAVGGKGHTSTLKPEGNTKKTIVDQGLFSLFLMTNP